MSSGTKDLETWASGDAINAVASSTWYDVISRASLNQGCWTKMGSSVGMGEWSNWVLELGQ